MKPSPDLVKKTLDLITQERTTAILKEKPQEIIKKITLKLSGPSSEWAQYSLKENESLINNATIFLDLLENFVSSPLPPLIC